MPTGQKLIKKNAYMAKLQELVENTPLTLIIGVDNVGSKQLQEIRLFLRGSCTILMGKNTMIRKALRKKMDAILAEDENADVSSWTNLLASIKGNMGFVFCQAADGLEKAREAIGKFVVPAMAKAGVIAQIDVSIPAGPTTLEPSQTNFFQTLNINTKIVKGHIEILSETKVCTKGEKVSLSAQALLAKMNIKPFEYGIQLTSVFQDGCVFDAAVLDIDDAVLIRKFLSGVSHVASFGRQIGVPTEAALPHMFGKAFKNIVAAVVKIDFSAGEKVDKIKAILSDPDALAAMQAAAAAPAATSGGDKPAAAAAAAVEEEEEEEEVDFDLFG